MGNKILKYRNPRWLSIISASMAGLLLFICGTLTTVEKIDTHLERTGSDLSFSLLFLIVVLFFFLASAFFGNFIFKWLLRKSILIGAISFIPLAFSVLLSLLLFLLFIISLDDDSLFPGLCGDEIINQISSPEGDFNAIIFERDCGATTSFSTHVALMPNNKPSSSTVRNRKRSVVVADCNHNAAPQGPGGGPEMRLRWLSNKKLEIQYHKLARIINAESMSKGISIQYSTFE